MEEDDEDQRFPHHRNPKEFVSPKHLADLGVLYWHLNPNNYENDKELQKIRQARGYNYMDMLDLCPDKVENYEQKLINFYTDEEIRYCLEGSGYFDVRGKDDRWIRIWITPGDLIILPAGIYHRFTLDTTNYIKDDREEVIQAWYMDDSDEDQRLPHHRNPKEFVSLEKLAELGVLSWRLDADNYETDVELKKIREVRGYSYVDLIEVCPEKLPNYEEKIKNFFEEHLHTDEEIRYCLAGSGYFDVRDHNDGWIRVWVKKGGMIVLPAGIYHRFTLDTDNYIKAMRLFIGDPVWTPFNRPHDHLPARKEYLEAFVQKEATSNAVDATA